MRKFLLATATSLTFFASNAHAQVPLTAYADANGFLNMQALTCGQLANTWQQDADMLSVWYSGWYNGLAKKHYMDIRKGKIVEHELILYCKAHPEMLIIHALAVVLKDERIKYGIKMKAE
jgi:hypothetical protein